jgi:hypothetical protein
MQDMQAYLRKLHLDAVDCAFSVSVRPIRRRKSYSTGSPTT